MGLRGKDLEQGKNGKLEEGRN